MSIDRAKELGLLTFLLFLSPPALGYVVLVLIDMLAEDDPLGLLAILPE